MSLTPKLPKIHWPDLIIHIPSMVLQWAVQIIGLQTVWRFGHGIVVNMFEFIPDAEITQAVVAGIVAFLAILAIVSQFVSNKKAEAVAEKKAKMEGTVYDAVNGEISQKMFWGYPVIALIAAVIIATIVMFAINEVETTQYAEYVCTQTRAVMVGAAASIIMFAVVDKYLLRAVMDGLFFEKIESPAVEKFLKGIPTDVEDAVKKVKSAKEQYDEFIAAGFSPAEALAEVKKSQ